MSVNNSLARVRIMNGRSRIYELEEGVSVYTDTDSYKITQLPDIFENCGIVAGFSNGGDYAYRPKDKIKALTAKQIYVLADEDDVSYYE